MPLRPPGRVSGNSPQAYWLNHLLEYVISLTPQIGPGILTDHTVRGVSRRPRAQAAGVASESREKQFILKAVKGDYLECLPYTSGAAIPATYEASDIVIIAKDPELQKSRFQGQTIEGWLYDVIDVTPEGGPLFEGIRRHATNGIKKEIQQVVPHYRIDWPVYAVKFEGLAGGGWLAVEPRIFAKTLDRVPEDLSFGATD